MTLSFLLFVPPPSPPLPRACLGFLKDVGDYYDYGCDTGPLASVYSLAPICGECEYYRVVGRAYGRPRFIW